MSKRAVQFVALTALAMGLLSIFTKPPNGHVGLRFVGDSLDNVSQRIKVECPKPEPGTVVLVGLGQSNAGNWGKRISNTDMRGDGVIEYWQDSCYVAASPMLGATGEGASLWPQLGQEMIHAGLAKKVIISVFAVDGAAIGRFVPQGDLWPRWRTQLKQLRKKYPIDYYLWLHGEADFARGTSKEEYIDKFGILQHGIVELDSNALVFVSVESYCADVKRWTPSNEVSRAQSEIPLKFPRALHGVNTDTLLSTENARWDGCHPSEHGYTVWSEAWTTRISHVMRTRTPIGSNSSQTLQ